jgi:hypothetical protein
MTIGTAEVAAFAAKPPGVVEVSLRIAMLDNEVLALDIAEVAHALHECFQQRHPRRLGAGGKLAEPVYFAGLLCARNKRPTNRRAAQKDDGLATAHLVTSPETPACRGNAALR